MAAMIASTEREELRLWNLDVRDRNAEREATSDFPLPFNLPVQLASRSPDDVHAAMKTFLEHCDIHSVPQLEREELVVGLEDSTPSERQIEDWHSICNLAARQLPTWIRFQPDVPEMNGDSFFPSIVRI